MKPLVSVILFSAITIAANSQSSSHLVQEDFSDNSRNWAINTTGDAIYTVSNGKYVMENSDDKARWSGLHVKLDPYSDYIIAATTTHTSGVKNTGYGILFGCKDNDNYYVFDIAPTGYYRLYTKINGEFTYPINWTKSSSIKTENYQDNIIKVQRYNSTWYFYVNGDQVGSYAAKGFIGDIIGFIKLGNQRIEFDDLDIYGVSSSGGNSSNNSINNSSYNNNGNVSFYDDFSTKKDEWGDDDDDAILSDKAYSLISDGKLILRSYKDTTTDRGISAYLDTKKPFTISADFNRKYGETSNAPYGFSLESKDGSSGAIFYISANGYYEIKEVQSDGTSTGEWKDCPYVNKGSALNTIKIDGDGSYWSLYVNGRYCGLVTAKNIYHPSIFLISNQDQRLECDNFALSGSMNK